MPTYIIEREVPGASALTDDELRGITTKSNDTVAGLGRPYTWRYSYVAGDKIYCVHETDDIETIYEHARRGWLRSASVNSSAARSIGFARTRRWPTCTYSSTRRRTSRSRATMPPPQALLRSGCCSPTGGGASPPACWRC